MLTPIFLTPVFQERIWGGTRLRDTFAYNIISEQTGECWAISAHPNGQSIVRDGEFKGFKLGDLYERHPELFGNPMTPVFPLLTKILDANKDLSVQVHPDDSYARAYENGELGKTECWYIIDCKEGAEVIIGHHAKSGEELKAMIANKEWELLLRREKIKPGDFFYVPSGTIHALCEGTLVLETQQSSDTTYRVYDYERVDENGMVRELHLEKALDVITVPHRASAGTPKIEATGNCKTTTFVEESYFSVYKWEVSGETTLAVKAKYLLASVIAGAGELEHSGVNYPLNKGDHFILPVDFGEFLLKGELSLIISEAN